MRPAKIVAIVIGALLILIGLAFLVPGSFLLWLDRGKDDSGFLSTSDRALSSAGRALTTPSVRLDIGAGDWVPGDVAAQIRAESDNGGPIFVGIGPTDQVMAYLSGAAHDQVIDLGWPFADPEYLHYAGDLSPAPPGEQDFWVAREQGSGVQTLRWDVRDGEWMAVVMNADASAPIAARVSLGVRLGFLTPLGIGLTVFGVVLLAGGIVLVVIGARHPREPLQPVQAGGPLPSAVPQPAPPGGDPSDRTGPAPPAP